MQYLLKYFGFLMVLVYLGVGLLLILSGEKFALMSRVSRLILGILLIIYGCFRAYRVIQAFKNEKPD
jgi:cytochrome c biogenesis protein CcdA